MRITGVGTSAAYNTSAGKLTTTTAILIRIVAHRIVLEFTGLRVATVVVFATLFTATIAVFTFFHDAITTLVTGDGRDASIVGQTSTLHTVAAESRTYVANTAGTELRNTITRGRIHNVLRFRITRVGAERAALLRIDDLAICAGLRITIVHGSESMTGFVGDDLPLRRCLGHHVCTADRLVRVLSDLICAELTEPGQPDLGSSVAVREERPVRIRIIGVTSPLRKGVQSVRDRLVASTANIPWCRCGRGSRTRGVAHSKVLKTQRNVERLLVNIRGGIDLSNHVGMGGFGRVERSCVTTISGNSDQGNLPCRWTTVRLADAGL